MKTKKWYYRQLKKRPIELARNGVQIAFLLFILFIGFRFWQFYNHFASLGIEPFVERPSAVEGFLADSYGVTNTAIATAWITRHPADIQVVLGTTNPQRLKEACKGANLKLTREEWYQLYKSAGNIVP